MFRIFLKVTKGNTEHQKMCFAQKATKASAVQSPPQELEVGTRSRPYFLVRIIWTLCLNLKCAISLVNHFASCFKSRFQAVYSKFSDLL